jgi:hypothetical protein
VTPTVGGSPPPDDGRPETDKRTLDAAIEGADDALAKGDLVPDAVAEEEWLVRYADRKAVNRSGQVARGAWVSTRHPAQLSVDRLSFVDTLKKAEEQSRVRVFIRTVAVRTAASAGNVVADKPPPPHALIIPQCLPTIRAGVAHKDELSAEEFSALSAFCDGLRDLSTSRPPEL